jgi:hypothetical protein
LPFSPIRAIASALSKRSRGLSPVVPWMRRSAISRLHHYKWLSIWPRMSKQSPAVPLRFA